MEVHGGRIEAFSDKEHTAFMVQLPIEEEKETVTLNRRAYGKKRRE